MRIHKNLCRLTVVSILLLCLAAGHARLDRWQRATIFSVELGESRWWREPPPGTDEYYLSLENGDKVQAWYLPADVPDAPTVLYLHGSRWNLNSSVFRMERWSAMGYAILAIDYRGFGSSSQRLPSQASAVEDATAALRELARRQPLPERRFVYGHSLGGAIAIAMAAQEELPIFNGLIVESTFTRIQDMIAHSKWSHLPGLDLLVTQPFDSLSVVGRIQNPLLILHGTNDSVVPPAMSNALFRAAASGTALRKLVHIEGGSHSNSSARSDYKMAVQDFIGQALASHLGTDPA
ncbi:alpha/beta fold hydrolase [Alcaligenaceae bacterium]|nr:alpha/beta fold hydrolase [Alcaligenaceae bacterium]